MQNLVGLILSDYTTQEYFERIRESRFPHAQVVITTACITYLPFDVFQGDYYLDGDYSKLHTLLLTNALFDYAARCWGHHARGHAEETRSIQNLVLKFLEDTPNWLFVSRVKFVQSFYIQILLERFPKQFSPMHISALFGLPQTTRCLLQINAGADSKEEIGRTPLSWAAEEGHEGVVRVLLERDDIDINSKKDIYGQTLIWWVAYKGHVEVVRVLLAQNGIDVNSRDFLDRTPLSVAAAEGHATVVKLLLTRDDVDVNSGNKFYGGTLLSQVAEMGHQVVLRLLLERDDVNVNSSHRVFGQTPLS